MSIKQPQKSCPLCEDINDSDHQSSIAHKFNFMLFAWNKYRKRIIQGSHGISISVKLADFINGTRLKYIEDYNKGTCTVTATVAQAKIQNANGINFLFTVRNDHSARPAILCKIYLLHPDSSFNLLQVEGAENINAYKQLLPGATYTFKVRYLPRQVCVGSFKIPVIVNLQTINNESFSIGREMIINVSDEIQLLEDEAAAKKSPFTSDIWEYKVKRWFGARQAYKPPPDLYSIPKKYVNLIKSGLTEYQEMPDHERIILNELKKMIVPGYPTAHNYKDFFHVLLWLDEIAAILMLKRYNMEKVTMTRLPGDFLELIVPGLAEKRPSLIKGDYVKMRLHGSCSAGYIGIIKIVKDKSIWISCVHTDLTEYIQDNPGIELDVSFQLSRLNYERMHAALDKCVRNGMVRCLFPDAPRASSNDYTISNIGFLNPDIINNCEQREAVLNILNCKSGNAPYIVFGPPGTGKTVTIVEAMLQIKALTNKRILVCAPANAACDWIAEKLIATNQCSKRELLRLHSINRDWSSVPEIIKPYSNYLDGAINSIEVCDLLKYRIVISTLVNIGRYFSKYGYDPDFVFIDEAAQAMEPEVLIPIAFLKPGMQLVLAGDPQQLGPMCASAVAEKYKLGVSLLERLMTMPIYKTQNCISMLKLNFRSHPLVLQLPNKLFYDGKLQAKSKYALTDPIAKISVYCKIFNMVSEYPGQPEEFCSVISKEKKEGNSPSYFNEREIEMVLKYVKALLTLKETKVSADDIGIITPYKRQVYRIKDKLKQDGYSDIEVGTVESFQGREKRIVIISTVRAQNCLLLHDKMYKLGFVKNEKRFNVAVTRAISKLIVIGCPNVLRYDKKCWLAYIDNCQRRGSYFGAKMDCRTEMHKREVISRLENIELLKNK